MGFGVVIVVLGILLPRVLHSLEAFLVTFLDKATILLEHINAIQ